MRLLTPPPLHPLPSLYPTPPSPYPLHLTPPTLSTAKKNLKLIQADKSTTYIFKNDCLSLKLTYIYAYTVYSTVHVRALIIAKDCILDFFFQCGDIEEQIIHIAPERYYV